MAWMRQSIKGKSRNANAATTVDERNDLYAGAKTDASVSNTQTACHNKSKRIAVDGVTRGTKCGIESARLERATDAAREAWVGAVTALNEKWTPKGRDKEREAASHLNAAEIAERNF